MLVIKTRKTCLYWKEKWKFFVLCFWSEWTSTVQNEIRKHVEKNIRLRYNTMVANRYIRVISNGIFVSKFHGNGWLNSEKTPHFQRKLIKCDYQQQIMQFFFQAEFHFFSWNARQQRIEERICGFQPRMKMNQNRILFEQKRRPYA